MLTTDLSISTELQQVSVALQRYSKAECMCKHSRLRNPLLSLSTRLGQLEIWV